MEPLKRSLAFVRDVGRPFLLMLVLLGLFRSAVADWNDVPTGSMKPTILEGDRIVVNKIAYDLQVPFTDFRLLEVGQPQRGDIIVFFSPADRTRMVKRVIGLPGDRITIRRNRIEVNGIPAAYASLPNELMATLNLGERRNQRLISERIGELEHPILTSIRATTRSTFGPVTVPPNQYFVLGDNRDNSLDSRWFGFVDRRLIEGKATTVALSVDPEHYFMPRWERFLSRLR